jgi:hypothetical protein
MSIVMPMLSNLLRKTSRLMSLLLPIIIPKDYHYELDKLNPKQVNITIDNEI